jgi:hypothetical protein
MWLRESNISWMKRNFENEKLDRTSQNIRQRRKSVGAPDSFRFTVNFNSEKTVLLLTEITIRLSWGERVYFFFITVKTASFIRK